MSPSAHSRLGGACVLRYVHAAALFDTSVEVLRPVMFPFFFFLNSKVLLLNDFVYFWIVCFLNDKGQRAKTVTLMKSQQLGGR